MLQALLASAGPDARRPDHHALPRLRPGAWRSSQGAGGRGHRVRQQRAGRSCSSRASTRPSSHVDQITPLPGPGLVVGTATLAAKHDALKAFVAATLRAMTEIKADPQKGVDASINGRAGPRHGPGPASARSWTPRSPSGPAPTRTPTAWAPSTPSAWAKSVAVHAHHAGRGGAQPASRRAARDHASSCRERDALRLAHDGQGHPSAGVIDVGEGTRSGLRGCSRRRRASRGRWARPRARHRRSRPRRDAPRRARGGGARTHRLGQPGASASWAWGSAGSIALCLFLVTHPV